jgi:hypothetical protein
LAAEQDDGRHEVVKLIMAMRIIAASLSGMALDLPRHASTVAR